MKILSQTCQTFSKPSLGWRLSLLALGLFVLSACDPEHRKKCEWYLMPDTKRTTPVDAGFIPVCARNLVTVKQDCRLQTTLKFAEKVYGKKFRYVDLKVKNYGLPRTIESIDLCEE